jgi:hypothetical protein
VIRYSTQVAEPGDVSVSITLTMTVNEWRSFLLKVNENHWPADAVGSIIAEAICEYTTRLESGNGGVR